MTNTLKAFLLTLVPFCLAGTAEAARKQPKKVRVRVEATERNHTNSIVSLPLSSPLPMTVREVTGRKNSPCVSQWTPTREGSTIHWRVDGMLKKDEVREYSIEPADTVPPASGKMNVGKDRDGNLILRQNGQNIIQYNTKIRQLPPDTDPSYQRAGYLHPVWSPAGRILTEINPADHLHHYGIWNPWTSILYDGGMYDLWNLIKKQGTVQLDSILGTTAGDLFSDIRVRHDHVIFRPGEQQTVATPRFSLKITPKEETVILHENLGIRAWATGDNIFMWDFCSDLTPSTDFPVTMKAYRYAGFCFRATADWTAQNCRMMTSEGKTRPEIDGTTARWIWIEGTSPEGDSGILFMSHPANPRHPEPLRVWNAKANKGRGDVMANFSPSKKEDWTLEPGKTYRLRYRVVTYDGRMTSERAEALWQEFAAPPTVTVK